MIRHPPAGAISPGDWRRRAPSEIAACEHRVEPRRRGGDRRHTLSSGSGSSPGRRGRACPRHTVTSNPPGNPVRFKRENSIASLSAVLGSSVSECINRSLPRSYPAIVESLALSSPLGSERVSLSPDRTKANSGRTSVTIHIPITPPSKAERQVGPRSSSVRRRTTPMITRGASHSLIARARGRKSLRRRCDPNRSPACPTKPHAAPRRTKRRLAVPRVSIATSPNARPARQTTNSLARSFVIFAGFISST